MTPVLPVPNLPSPTWLSRKLYCVEPKVFTWCARTLALLRYYDRIATTVAYRKVRDHGNDPKVKISEETYLAYLHHRNWYIHIALDILRCHRLDIPQFYGWNATTTPKARLHLEDALQRIRYRKLGLQRREENPDKYGAPWQFQDPADLKRLRDSTPKLDEATRLSQSCFADYSGRPSKDEIIPPLPAEPYC